jgi:hypothetical protein
MTIPKLIQMIATACGIHQSTLARYFAELRTAKLIRVSGKGGGKAAVHLDHWEAATVLAALCALGPGGATDAVATFKRIRCDGTRQQRVRNDGLVINPVTGAFGICQESGSLWNDLVRWIGAFANEICAHPDRKPAEHGWMSTWELVACLDSSMAWISYIDAEDKKIVLEYSDPQSEILEPNHQHRRRGIRQMAHVDATALEVFARVFLDFFVTPHAEAAAKLNKEAATTKTAASPAREAAGSPDRPNDESTKMGAQQSHPKRGKKKPQPHAASRSGHSHFSLNRSDSNERRRQNPARLSSP